MITVRVAESSDGGAPAARSYCYDARGQLAAETAGGACTPTSGDEVYAYDAAGDRASAAAGGATRTFAYGPTGQLASCAAPACSVSYDAEGRMRTVTDTNGTWTFAYDADGKLVSACAASSCSGSGFNRVDWLYDGDGHRTQVRETTGADGSVCTTSLRYAGDAVVQESTTSKSGTTTRTYATDDSGRVVEVCDPDCSTGAVYVVAWNGHGDATGLWRRNADGTLTLANSYAYSTWGAPTTTVAPGFADLGFRFLYVGASDVQWDDSFGLGLYYMHAREYSPSLGRFLQPDPARADGNLYRYAGNSPVTKTDSSGLGMSVTCLILLWRIYARYVELVYRQRAIEANEGIGNGPLPMYGPRMTVESHQVQFREKQANLQRLLMQWSHYCSGPNGGQGGARISSACWYMAYAPTPTPRSRSSSPDYWALAGGIAGTAVSIWWGVKLLAPVFGPFAPLWAVAG